MEHSRISRRRFLQIAAGSGIGLAAYGSLYGERHLVVERVPIVLSRLPEPFDGFTIAQISDLHFGRLNGASWLKHVVERINGLQPDLVTLTGDYVTQPRWGSGRLAARNAEPCAQILKDLRPRYGTFAVLGNHDVGTWPEAVRSALEAHHIRVLVNEAVSIEHNGARLWLAGVNDVLARRADLTATLQFVPGNECTVLLAHEPDFADKATRYPIDLQLSGHSHGGQIRIPLLGAPVLPPLARKYPWGYYRIGNLQLYSNRGVGCIHVPIRVFSPPEITLITLTRP